MHTLLKRYIVFSFIVAFLTFLFWIAILGHAMIEANKLMGMSNFRIIESPYKRLIQTAVVASWYDREHCLGCSHDLRMANGDILTGDGSTVAFNYAPLNTPALVCSPGHEFCREFMITDRMGRKNRVDISSHLVFNYFDDAGHGNGGLVDVIVYHYPL